MALLGTLLRWHQLAPVEGLVYPWWLHAHSHLAFLGWLFNAFFLLFTQNLPSTAGRSARRLFGWMQLPLVGMLLSFPLSGYSAVSIFFSTLHICFAWFFAWKWWRHWQQQLSGSWLPTARAALVLMVISNVGPFVVGAAQATENRTLYEQALHFYLYFQYAGWFSLAAWAVLQRHFDLDGRTLLRPLLGYLLAYYAFSTWWSGGAAVPLLVMLAMLIWLLLEVKKMQFTRTWSPLLVLIVSSWALKNLLELLYLVPAIAHWSEHIRLLQIGYLHLYFLGILSSTVLLTLRPARRWQLGWVLGAGFTLLLLLLGPWLGAWLGHEWLTVGLFTAALALLLIIFFYFLNLVQAWQISPVQNR